jgi:hypothetical protein
LYFFISGIVISINATLRGRAEDAGHRGVIIWISDSPNVSNSPVPQPWLLFDLIMEYRFEFGVSKVLIVEKEIGDNEETKSWTHES